MKKLLYITTQTQKLFAYVDVEDDYQIEPSQTPEGVNLYLVDDIPAIEVDGNSELELFYDGVEFTYSIRERKLTYEEQLEMLTSKVQQNPEHFLELDNRLQTSELNTLVALDVSASLYEELLVIKMQLEGRGE